MPTLAGNFDSAVTSHKTGFSTYLDAQPSLVGHLPGMVEPMAVDKHIEETMAVIG